MTALPLVDLQVVLDCCVLLLLLFASLRLRNFDAVHWPAVVGL